MRKLYPKNILTDNNNWGTVITFAVRAAIVQEFRSLETTEEA
jgi:hypothetical protein